jgi:hypothetical protein
MLDYVSDCVDDGRRIVRRADAHLLDGRKSRVSGSSASKASPVGSAAACSARSRAGLQAFRERVRERGAAAGLHYAPVADTLEGEPLEIFPFLGCSRLAEVIDRFKVTARRARSRSFREIRGPHTGRTAGLQRCLPAPEANESDIVGGRPPSNRVPIGIIEQRGGTAALNTDLRFVSGLYDLARDQLFR